MGTVLGSNKSYRVSIDSLKGNAGDEIELQVTDEAINWKYSSETTWHTLIEVALLQKPASDAAAAAQAVIDEGTELNSNPPKIQDGTWWLYNYSLHRYVDSTLPSTGHAPIVKDNGHFWNWDDSTGDYVDSGVVASAGFDPSNVPVTFSEVVADANLSSGETVATLFGRIQHWFNRLGALAFLASADFSANISGKPTTLSGYGITDADTSAAVTAKVAAAITTLQQWAAAQGYELASNKVDLSASATATQYPNAASVWSVIQSIANDSNRRQAAYYGKTKAATVVPAPDSIYLNYYDFTSNTYYDAAHNPDYVDATTTPNVDPFVWVVRETIVPVDDMTIGISSKFLDLDVDPGYPGQAIYSAEDTAWGYYPKKEGAPDNTSIGIRASDGAWYVIPNWLYTLVTPLTRTIAGLALSADITAAQLKSALGLNNDFSDGYKDELDYQTGYTAATSLSNLPASEQLVSVELTASQTSLSLSGTLRRGRTLQIFCHNASSADIAVAIPTASPYVNMGDASYTIAADGWLEIHITALSGGIYNVRVGEQG
jgi:hypothetical protein